MSKSQKTPGSTQPPQRADSDVIKPRDPLARELFKARIHNQTIPSLGEDDPWVTVSFSSFQDLDRFLQLVTRGEPEDSLDRRILLAEDRSGEAWGYSINPLKRLNRPQIEYSFSVGIPVSDLSEVLKRVRESNALFDDLADGR